MLKAITVTNNLEGIYMPKSKFKWIYKKDYEHQGTNC
jgi:hypothetical protein